MNTYCTIYKANQQTLRFINQSWGVSEHIEAFFNHVPACYFDWERIKTYKLK